MDIRLLKSDLKSGCFDEKFSMLYCVEKSQVCKIVERYLDLIIGFEKHFQNHNDVSVFSAPGRTEIGGNHTDHQKGIVLAGSVNLDVIAVVALNGTNKINVQSKGYPLDVVDLDDLEVDETEFNQAKALIKGVVSKFKQKGVKISGFDAYTESNVLKGSGLSSSAAFEVLLGNVINGLFNNSSTDAIEIAQIGQYAENVYFGKPSGLMDQMASSVGGVVSIDFKDVEKPIIRKINFDFSSCSHALCIIDSGADHADLTGEYAAIPSEMKKVAQFFGKNYLREVDEAEFFNNISKVKKSAGDRAVLRAMHFFEENKRAKKEAFALENGNFDEFLAIVKESGYSSFMYLQNVFVSGSNSEQAVAYTLALCDKFLDGHGAYRVHGGGFAGTVQAFVPIDMLDDFKNNIEKSLLKGACHVLSLRPLGGIQIA